MPQFNEVLRELRTGKKMSQKELGDMVGVTNNQIFNWESGRGAPGEKELKALSVLFNCTLGYLLGQSPFKNREEESHSIIVAAMGRLMSPNEELEEHSDFIISSILDLLHNTKDVYTVHTRAYIKALLDKSDQTRLSNQELYDLAKFSIDNFNWPSDYRGPVSVQIQNESITVLIDYWKIPKVLIDESKSMIVYAKDGQSVSMVKFRNREDVKELLPLYRPELEGLTTAEIDKLAEYALFIKSQRKEKEEE